MGFCFTAKYRLKVRHIAYKANYNRQNSKCIFHRYIIPKKDPMLGLYSWYIQVGAIGVLSGFFAEPGDWIVAKAFFVSAMLEASFCALPYFTELLFAYTKSLVRASSRTKKKHQNHLVFFLGSGDWIVAKATATQQCSKQVSVRCIVLPTTASLYSWFESRATGQRKKTRKISSFFLAPETGFEPAAN